MAPMIARAMLAAGGLVLAGAAVADGDAAVRTLQSHDWQVSEAHCAGRCPEDAAAFARRMIGTGIVARERTFSSSFSDACSNGAGYEIRRRPTAEVVREIGRALPPGAASRTGLLGLPAGTVVGGLVYCGQDADRTAIANLTAIDARRLLVMIEGGMFLVAVPKP